MLLRKIYKMRA